MRTENCETVRNGYGVVSAVEVLYSVSYGLVHSPSCSGFLCHPQDLAVPAREEEAVADRLCPSLPGLVVPIPPLSKVPQQNGWSGLVGEVCGSWEGARGGAGARRKG